jgi:hypothetical protein
MKVPRDKVSYEERRMGAVGDPRNLHVSGEALAKLGFRCDRPVRDGIRDALASLGWKS